MGNLILETLPYAVAAMAAASGVIVVSALIISKAERPVRSTGLFALGALLLDLVLTVVVLAAYRAAGLDSGGDASAWIDVILGGLFFGLGVKAVFSHPTAEEQAAQRARIEKVAGASTVGLLTAGVLVELINADAMSMLAGGLKEIAIADPTPSTPEVIVVLAIFLFIMLIPYHLPIELHLVSPDRSGRWMKAMSGWILDRSRILEVVVGLAFGVFFLSKGLAVLVD